MPRLSLYKPERGQDYKFIDRQVSEMFQVGGTDVYLHKYIGVLDPTDNTQTLPVTAIQDVVFLENRDRKYDSSIYKIRGLYNVQNIDFNLSQFGLFIDNDTVYMTVHINDFIKYIGRKPISGDVIELPHLRDQFALFDADVSLPRYYTIEDVGRASEGFSATWFPHLYRLKLKKITAGQQYADILNQVATDVNGDPDPSGTTLKDLLSTYNQEIAINNSVLSEAEANASQSGYETRQFYTLAVDDKGRASLQTADETELDASNASYASSSTENKPQRTGYTGYLVGDGFPANGYDFGHGIQFPELPGKDDFFLRTDFLPNRLFRFDGVRWIKVEDAVRMNMTNNDTRQTLKTSFINNTKYLYDQAVGIDYIKLPPDIIPPATTVPANYNYVFNTEILYTTALYVVFKLDTLEIVYTTADHLGLLTSYNYTNPDTNEVTARVRITLPIIDTVQETLIDGLWRVSLCNGREEQRQSLSKVLKYKPEADL
jgi:hypothetical protein